MQIERRRLDSLQLDPDNAREHDKANIDAIKASLEKFGQRKPIVVADGVVIAGNGTMEAAQALGWEEIDTVSADDLDETERRAYAIADNRTAELAKWNQAKLAEALSSVTEDGDAMGEATGFDHQAIVDLVEQHLAETREIVEDEVPEVEEETVTKPGDLWVLGEHRLLCGDSTKAEDVARVMGGEKAVLVHADPPYGMGKEKDGVANDNLYREKLDAFQMAWWKACRESVARQRQRLHLGQRTRLVAALVSWWPWLQRETRAAQPDRLGQEKHPWHEVGPDDAIPRRHRALPVLPVGRTVQGKHQHRGLPRGLGTRSVLHGRRSIGGRHHGARREARLRCQHVRPLVHEVAIHTDAREALPDPCRRIPWALSATLEGN